MSAEKIIEQIKKDSEKEIKKINKETEKIVADIIESAKQEAKNQAKQIIEKGKQESQDQKEILISQARQDANREKMNTREKVISKCFSKAKEKLSKISGSEYEKIVDSLIKKGSEKISGEVKIYISKDSDKRIAEKNGLEVAGRIDSIGGVILSSNDGKITLDNTFEGILKRERNELRNKIGKMLFST